jgi:gamma-glutamylputrescine oxidase
MTDPAVYGSSWYAATMVQAPARPPLAHELDVDVCVVGGGLAGLTTAREIARRGWSVALLEANRVAWDASGRNDGFVLPGFGEDIGRVIARVGLPHAKRLWALADTGLDYVRRTIAETEMPGVDPVAGWLDVSKVDNRPEMVRRHALLAGEFGVEVEGWPIDRVREALRTRYYFDALYYPRAFHIHPLNYALGLAADAERAGARIYENTPALTIDADGVRKRIATPAAQVRASHVVIAGGAHLGALMPKLAGTVLPVWSYVVTTAPLGERLLEAITTTAAVTDTAWADNHYRIVGGDRLLWSGRVRTWDAGPNGFARALRGDIRRLYPQLGKVAVDHVWSGKIGRSVHKMPQVGELSPGLWVAGGFGGHGLNTTAMAGQLVARGVVDNDRSWTLFTPYELVWAGGTLGRAAAQAVYWVREANATAAAALARRREARRRRALQRAGAAAPAADSGSAAHPDTSPARLSAPAAAPDRIEPTPPQVDAVGMPDPDLSVLHEPAPEPDDAAAPGQAAAPARSVRRARRVRVTLR